MKRRTFLKVVLGACFLPQLPTIHYMYYYQYMNGKWALHEKWGLRGLEKSLFTDFDGVYDEIMIFEHPLTRKEVQSLRQRIM